METRQSLRTIPSRPLVIAIALLAVVALALTAWYALGTRSQTTVSPSFHVVPMPNQLPMDCKNDPISPRDPVCTPYHDPHSPHDPVGITQ